MTKRTPREVTADRLRDHFTDPHLDGAERDAFSRVIHILELLDERRAGRD